MISAALVALALSAAASAAPSLSLTISGAKNFSGIDTAVVTATLTNTGDEAVTLLNDPNTILSKMETNTFAIANAKGASPEFVGKAVKYVPTRANNTVTTLQPGESFSLDHALGDAYDFTSTGAGKYSIETSSRFTAVTDSGLQTITADTTAHEANLSGALVKRERSLRARLDRAKRRLLQRRTKRETYSSCSTSEKSQISTATPYSNTYASGAYDYLVANTASTTRYTTWFGTYTSSRHSTVESHYEAMTEGDYTEYTYDCSCTDSDTYAYTYADEAGEVWLCGAFWDAPTTGTDSKAGTLIHESSHWNSIAGTEDYVYGQTAAKQLAKSSPSEAIENADNHEYFAENNPALS